MANVDWRNLTLSDYEVETKKHYDGGVKRKRRKKGRKEEITKRPDITGLQPLSLPKEETEALLAAAFANLPVRHGPQNKNKKRRGIQRQKIYRKAYKIQARQRHESNLRKMAKRSRVARECREMRALAWELEPEWNARIGLFGNPNVKRKEYPWMRGRPKDSMIMRRRADEEGIDAMERYERLHKERSQRREEGWEKREERWRESRA